MGNLQAMEMVRLADQDTALSWHLRSNHYPPIHPVFIPVAKTAIEKAVEATLLDMAGDDHELWDEQIPFPEGAELPSKRLIEIIDELHLHAFVDAALAYDDPEDDQS